MSNTATLRGLAHKLTVLNKELAAAEELLNDGIEYDREFVKELHAHVADTLKVAVRVKGILVKRYGVVAI